ncbi:MAG: hypothetical protein M1821_004874 [Bathelium mastoideum]|nr:MAG: hypothetical protein M1821_004874 [Bathelium mastoideum]
MSLSYRVNVTTESQLTNNPEYAAKAAVDYYTNRTGPLQSGGGNFVGWEKVPPKLRQNLSRETLLELNKFPSDWPELELLPLASSAIAAPKGENYAEVSVAVVATSSRGNVTITSSNTQDNPLVNPNWLATKMDQEVSIQGFRRARDIAASWGAAVDFEVNPGLAVETDAQILDFLRSNTVPIHHASATCESNPFQATIAASSPLVGAMGKKSDPNAVVDSRGRVFGLKGLRVIDASSFPLLPPGHIQSTVYMLAEKLADDIKSGR